MVYHSKACRCPAEPPAAGQAAAGLAALAQLWLVLREIIGTDETAAHIGNLFD